eukprot:scaffold296321_cov38-Attheya_sp.AAC.1
MIHPPARSHSVSRAVWQKHYLLATGTESKKDDISRVRQLQEDTDRRFDELTRAQRARLDQWMTANIHFPP